MKNVIAKFTDSYGIQHDAAVVEVSYGNKSVTSYETIGDSPTSQVSVSVTMQYRYWHSVDAKVANSRPLQFVDKSGQSAFSLNLASAEEVGDLEMFALSHFASVVLPTEGGSLVEVPTPV